MSFDGKELPRDFYVALCQSGYNEYGEGEYVVDSLNVEVFATDTDAKRQCAHVVAKDKKYNFEEDYEEDECANCLFCTGVYRIEVEQSVRFQSQRI